MLVGGFHGTWIPADRIATVRLDDESLRAHGGSLGAGVIVALDESACPARSSPRRWPGSPSRARTSAGPARNGLPALAGLLAAMAAGRAPRDCHRRLERWCGDVTGSGACHLPDGAVALPVPAALRVFADELSDHVAHGPCKACVRRPRSRHPRHAELAA